MKPGDLEHVLVRLKKWKKPLLICETGVADARDQYRRQWLVGTIAATHRAMGAGVDIIGYTAWSMFDNFEWAYGRWPRFGLVAIDYKDGLRRTVRPSGVWYARLIKQMRGL
jgi:beta-glucosidase